MCCVHGGINYHGTKAIWKQNPLILGQVLTQQTFLTSSGGGLLEVPRKAEREQTVERSGVIASPFFATGRSLDVRCTSSGTHRIRLPQAAAFFLGC